MGCLPSPLCAAAASLQEVGSKVPTVVVEVSGYKFAPPPSPNLVALYGTFFS